jgi:hypothetical protein
MEQRLAVAHGRAVAGRAFEKIDEQPRFGFGRGLPHAPGEIGEGAEIVVDEHSERRR